MELHSKTVKRLFPAAPQPIKLIHHSEKEEIPQTPPLSESGNSVVLGNDATLDNAFVEDYSGECSNISNDLWNKDVSVEVAKPNQDLWETVKEIVEESVLSEQHSSFFSSSSYLDNYPDVKSTMGSIKPSADNEAIHSYSSSITTATESETEIVVFQYPKHRLH
ncbi:hypothetical protein HDV04_003704 [Boothiomyces sp. JEL0838]|nr:hypothetical protein HDV04_003704 [Boothiomyces sp. JEL0838]